MCEGKTTYDPVLAHNLDQLRKAIEEFVNARQRAGDNPNQIEQGVKDHLNDVLGDTFENWYNAAEDEETWDDSAYEVWPDPGKLNDVYQQELDVDRMIADLSGVGLSVFMLDMEEE